MTSRRRGSTVVRAERSPRGDQQRAGQHPQRKAFVQHVESHRCGDRRHGLVEQRGARGDQQRESTACVDHCDPAQCVETCRAPVRSKMLAQPCERTLSPPLRPHAGRNSCAQIDLRRIALLASHADARAEAADVTGRICRPAAPPSSHSSGMGKMPRKPIRSPSHCRRGILSPSAVATEAVPSRIAPVITANYAGGHAEPPALVDAA